MGSSFEFYTRLFATVVRLCRDEVSNITQLVTLSWMVVDVLQARSSAPSKLAPYLPGDILAASHGARVRRWLKNPRIDTWKLYRPLLGAVLLGWERSNIYWTAPHLPDHTERMLLPSGVNSVPAEEHNGQDQKNVQP
jgi:hypothetical protein